MDFSKGISDSLSSLLIEEFPQNRTINSREAHNNQELLEYSKVELDDVKPSDYRISSTINKSRSFIK